MYLRILSSKKWRKGEISRFPERRTFHEMCNTYFPDNPSVVVAAWGKRNYELVACRSLKDKKEPGHKSNVRVRTADALKNSFNGGQLKRESHTIGRSKDIFIKVQCRSVSNYSYGIFFIVFGWDVIGEKVSGRISVHFQESGSVSGRIRIHFQESGSVSGRIRIHFQDSGSGIRPCFWRIIMI